MLALRTGTLAAAVLVLAGSASAYQETKTKKQVKLLAEEGAVEVVLLRHKAVREELKVSDEQAGKIKEFAGGQWKKAQAVHELPKDKQEARWKAMTKENEEFLHKTLSAEQLQRLQQVGMQVAGLLWVTRPDIARKLELTADQKKKIHAMQKEAHKEMHEVVHGSGSEKEKAEKYKELSETNRKRLLGVLTDKQKAEWKEMAGKKFTGDLSKD